MSQNNFPKPTPYWSPIEIPLADDALRTGRLNSITKTNGGAAAWIQFRTCIHFEFWNDRVESVSTTLVAWIDIYVRRQQNNFFSHERWLDTDFFEGFKHIERRQWLWNVFCLSSSACRWTIRPIWWMVCFDIFFAVSPDLAQLLGYPASDPSGSLVSYTTGHEYHRE